MRSHKNKVSLIISFHAHTRTHKTRYLKYFAQYTWVQTLEQGIHSSESSILVENLLEPLQDPSTVLEADLATTGQWWTNEATSASCLPPTISQDKDIAFVSLTHSLWGPAPIWSGAKRFWPLSFPGPRQSIVHGRLSAVATRGSAGDLS